MKRTLINQDNQAAAVRALIRRANDPSMTGPNTESFLMWQRETVDTLRRVCGSDSPEFLGFINLIQGILIHRYDDPNEIAPLFQERLSQAIATLKAIEKTVRKVREKYPLVQNEETTMNIISILFLAADPTSTSRLRLGEEFREIGEQLRQAKQRDHFALALPQLSLRPKDISGALLDVQPQVVHFSGHGTSEGALCFENETGQVHLVQPDALAALFEQFANQVNCVLLNACYSEIQARAIAEHINNVIGMNKAIGDKAAIAFSTGFYQALGAGRTIENAYKLGCVQIRLQGIPEHLTPVLVKKGQAQS